MIHGNSIVSLISMLFYFNSTYHFVMQFSYFIVNHYKIYLFSKVKVHLVIDHYCFNIYIDQRTKYYLIKINFLYFPVLGISFMNT